jgi:Rne/Rng family ribonuclease
MRRLLIEHGFGETRLALVEGERLAEFRMARGEDRARPGSLHLGRVLSVDPGLAAAFVEIGAEKPGLLPLRDAGKGTPSDGDPILVQVTRAPVEEKGVRLSARPVLAGRGMALRPGRAGLAFSPGLADPVERERIRQALRPELPAELGVSVERAAMGSPPEVLRAELRSLVRLWTEIAQRAASQRPPALLFEGPGAVERALLDWGAAGMEILCNDRALAASAARVLAERLPDLALSPRIEPAPALLEAEGVEEQLDAALRAEAPIPGGGFLVIEPGRTLTAIDVNTGSGDRRPREVNLAAAAEIAHQLRLRAIGGLVVIDFIDLRTPSARGPVLERLAEALTHDPAGCDLAGATRLGLVELTRRRTGPSLAELLTEPCGWEGSGRVRRIDTIGSALLRKIAAEARAAPGQGFAVTCAAEIAAALDGRLAAARAELERRLGRPVKLRADPSLAREEAHIRAEPASADAKDGR